jgi:hypothetical protein
VERHVDFPDFTGGFSSFIPLSRDATESLKPQNGTRKIGPGLTLLSAAGPRRVVALVNYKNIPHPGELHDEFYRRRVRPSHLLRWIVLLVLSAPGPI